MIRRLLTGLCFALVLSMVSGTLTAQAQESVQDTPVIEANPVIEATPAIDTYEDRALATALRQSGLLGAWTAGSSVAPETSLIAVQGSDQYQTDRTQLIVALRGFAEASSSTTQRAADFTDVERRSDELDLMVRAVRDELLRSDTSHPLGPETARPEVVSWTSDATDQALGWSQVSLDPLSLAQQRLARTRLELATVLDELEQQESLDAKRKEHMIDRLTQLRSDLKEVRLLARLGRDGLADRLAEFDGERNDLIVQMDGLHEQRRLASSSVAGLSLVTVDAYVKGAATLDPSCPVDWSLLAGIGRVESFHGTLGGSKVQASGRLTQSILGPLLDGGATEREAAEAALAAEAEADLLLAEELAAEAAEAEAVKFDATIWGEETVARAEAAAAATAPVEGVGLAAPPPPAVEAEEPLYDPVLWGDDLSFTNEQLADIEAIEAAQAAPDLDSDEEEIPELRGNGFAVIADSDDGRLDGNARWDRAVGPMQFIPETWSYWETDGNDDGVIDPQNLYDAAATAGRFLCHLSRTRGSSPFTFVLGYNSSNTYVRNVMDHAGTYGAKGLPNPS